MTDETNRQIAQLQRRVKALETVLVNLLRENAHQLVGGVAFVKQSLEEISDARD